MYLSFLPFPRLFICANGISVKTDLIQDKAVSRLYIANANRHDSGNYTCAIGDFARVTVAVHVLNGEFSRAAFSASSIFVHPVRGCSGSSAFFCLEIGCLYPFREVFFIAIRFSASYHIFVDVDTRRRRRAFAHVADCNFFRAPNIIVHSK